MICVLLIGSLAAGQDQQVYKLKNGDIITGTVVDQDSLDNTISVKTSFGVVKIDRNQLKQEMVIVHLKDGNLLQGLLITENETELRLQSSLGLLTVEKNLISNIEYGTMKAAGRTEKPQKFTLGDERQIDIFYDPTGYTLEPGVLYVSGLSWGFGVTGNFQITSRWAGYFNGNFNLRPKLQIFKSGNVDREHSLAVGAHYHTRMVPDKYEWMEGELDFNTGFFDYDDQNNYVWIPQGDTTVFYGGYQTIGSEINLDNTERRYNTEWEGFDSGWIDYDRPDPMEYYELFIAYTYSTSRAKTSGRISHTLGAVVGQHPLVGELLTRVYYGGAIDIRKNLIMNYELFWDPWYVEWWHRSEGLFDRGGELTMDKPDKPKVSPYHFDLGFIYSFKDWLRFGIHFQPYIFAVYFKF